MEACQPTLIVFTALETMQLTSVPYGGKLWRMETLVDLVNDHKFAKAKILCLIPPKFILPTVILQQIHQSLHPPNFPLYDS